MIASDRQYQHTRKKLAELGELIVATEAGDAGDDDFRDAQLGGLRSQTDDLRAQIAEYELEILAAARRGELGEGHDAEFIHAQASRLRES